MKMDLWPLLSSARPIFLPILLLQFARPSVLTLKVTRFPRTIHHRCPVITFEITSRFIDTADTKPANGCRRTGMGLFLLTTV